MAGNAIQVLLVEDNRSDARLIEETLADASGETFDVTPVGSLQDAMVHLTGEPKFDVVLLDLSLPDSNGIETVYRTQVAAPYLAILVLTGLDDEALGLEALRAGSQDYLVKGQLSGRSLVRAIRYARERKRLEDAVRAARDDLELRVQQRTAELALTVDELAGEVRERTRVEAQLRELNEALDLRAAQLRALTSELVQAEQRERRRLAQLLHDHLQQLLVAAKFGTGVILKEAVETTVIEAAQRVNGLLDEAIDASRTLTAELSPAVLYEGGLALALEWLGRQTERKYGLRIEISADGGVEPIGEETRILLFQAVNELLLNIVKHARVESARVEMRRGENDGVHIEVSDQGAGFDPSRKRASGEALNTFGLFSVGERIGLLDGRMDIASAPGQGTRVTLWAPRFRTESERTEALNSWVGTHVTHAPADVLAPALRHSRKAGPIRILLADDHKFVRQGLIGILDGHKDMEVVAEAADGKTAVLLALEKQPDVIIMDVNMPVLNGIEATRRIAAALPNVRVIGLSMHDPADKKAPMLAAGAAAYLKKGCPPEMLLAAIRGETPVPDPLLKTPV